MLRLAALLGGGTVFMLTSGCPRPPATCPNCDIKFTIKNYSELGQGYSIAGATLEADIETSDCPNNQSTCTEHKTAPMSQNQPGDYENVPSPFTLDETDTVRFNLKVKLVNGSQTVMKNETVTQYSE